MIQINCTNCKALLQIDDAFAGGVCRCRYCGTIQTVPKHLKDAAGDGGAAAATAAKATGTRSAKTLYKNKKGSLDPTGAGSGTGLDDLANVVASSGLSSKRLLKKEGAAPPAGGVGSPFKDRRTLLIVSGAGGVIVLLLAIILVMAVRDRAGGGGGGADSGGNNPAPVVNNTNHIAPVPNGGNNSAVNPPAAPPKAREPHFISQPIREKSVAYVIDRGTASQSDGRIDLTKQALIASLRSLGPDRNFTVAFWTLDEKKIPCWPDDGLRPATPANIEAVQKFLDDIYGVGQPKMGPAVEKVGKTGAEAIVLVPMKTFLDEGFHPEFMKRRAKAGSNAKVYCVTLNQPELAPQLQKIAADTKGNYLDVSLDTLRAAAAE